MSLYDREPTLADLEQLVETRAAEGQQLEFKKAPPEQGGGDRWSAKGELTDYAKLEILQEIVSFANSVGGTLVIGVAENGDRPPRADSLHPVPKYAELADSLAKVADVKVEPRLPGLNALPVPNDIDERGFVVLRVPQSRLAPHRLRYDNHCYVRRDDRNEKMTMQEIHDLTLLRYRSDEEIDARFRRCKDEFEEEIEDLAFFDAASPRPVIGTRITAVPQTPDIELERLDTLEGGVGYQQEWNARLGQSRIDRRLHTPRFTLSTRALLRGQRHKFEDKEHALYYDVFRNGTINYTLASFVPRTPADEQLMESRDRTYLTWILGAVLCVATTADRLRRTASSPDLPYGIEVQLLRAPLRWIRIRGGHGPNSVFGVDLAVGGNLLLPRLPLRSLAESRSRLVSTVTQDLYNSSGRDFEERVEVLPPNVF